MQVLPKESSNLLRRILLHLGGDVSVGVQRGCRRDMPDDGGQGFHIHPILQRQHSERMPLRYNYDKPEKPFNTNGF